MKDEWIVEVPKNGDPYQDYFKKKEEQKSDLVSKNEYQRLRNIAKERKTKSLRGNMRFQRKWMILFV